MDPNRSKQIRSVLLSGQQIRALIEAARYALDHNRDLTDDENSTLDLALGPLSKTLGSINFERSRNGERAL